MTSRDDESEQRCFAPGLFDTSPLQVHTHANFCMRMFTAAFKGLARARMQMHAIVCIRLLDTYLGDTGIKVTHGAEPTQTERTNVLSSTFLPGILAHGISDTKSP